MSAARLNLRSSRTSRTALAALALILSACAANPSRHTSEGEEPAPRPLRSGKKPVAATEPERVRILARAEIAAVGDVMMHGAVKDAAKAADQRSPDGASTNHEGFDALFEGVRDALGRADIGFANLETPVAPAADKGSRSFVFNAPPILLPALESAGVDVVSFANNHAYDQGRQGFAETLDQLDKAGLKYLGAGRTCEEASKARILEAHGIKIAFIGATKLYNDDLNKGRNEACAFTLDEAEALRQAKAAREAGAELVILSIHWGVEYAVQPRQVEIDQAHRLLDGGFDAILGHHPHVLQPVEVYETKDGRLTFVAYSLGNFISNQSRNYAHGVMPAKVGNPRDGVLLRFQAVRKDYGGGKVRTELADLAAEPLWTDNNALSRSRDPSQPAFIRVVHSDAAIRKAKEALATTTAADQALELQKRLELLEARRTLAGQILGEDLLP